MRPREAAPGPHRLPMRRPPMARRTVLGVPVVWCIVGDAPVVADVVSHDPDPVVHIRYSLKHF